MASRFWAQVWPYLQLVDQDPALRDMLIGTIRQQLKLIIRDPYANAFLDGLAKESEFKDDWTTIPGCPRAQVGNRFTVLSDQGLLMSIGR